MPFGHGGDQVAGAGQGHGGREFADDGGDFPFQSPRFQALIHGRNALGATCDQHMAGGCITLRRDGALTQGMARAHDADEAITQQYPRAHLGAGAAADDADFQIDRAVAQQAAVLVQFCHEAQAYLRRVLFEAGEQSGAEVFHEAIAAAQGEGTL